MPPLDFEEICDSARCPTPEALEAARRMVSDDPSADTRLLRALNIALLANDLDLPALERLLELLSEVSPPERLYPALRAALGHTDARVRSKAALVLGRKVENPLILEQLARDDDARVRANTVQALWGRDNPEIRALFGVALGDLHHRVAANAAYGLFLADPAGHAVRLVRFIRHPHPRFRRAGAWILRKIGDPAGLRLLQPLVTDKNAEVRTSAFTALVALRQIAAASGLAVEDPAQTP
jgi:HEAT repeat protein